MDEKVVFFTILGMALATYFPRVLPVWILASRPLPEAAVTWLRYVPAAVLSALLVPSLLLQEGKLHLAWDNLYLIAAIPTLLVAWKTRSLFGAVVVGMVVVAAGRFFFHL